MDYIADECLPRWLRLRDAVKYSALGRDRLVALAEAREIRAGQDPGNHDAWVFDRYSIDEYRAAQMLPEISVEREDLRKKLLAIHRRNRQ